MREVVIVANGQYPTHPIPLGRLQKCDAIVCCDGAAQKVVDSSLSPYAIVGDLDSLPMELIKENRTKIYHDPSQEYNDLTKAFNFSLSLRPQKITIVGATGLREDHTLGNISLLLEYSIESRAKVEMLTDSGIFEVILESGTFPSVEGMQISFFSMNSRQRVLSKGLKYPLDGTIFDNLWRATLNECRGKSYRIELLEATPLLLFREYLESDI
ncbi:MAG: thiamine diphosphokinase [Bacteroidales bacterium]